MLRVEMHSPVSGQRKALLGGRGGSISIQTIMVIRVNYPPFSAIFQKNKGGGGQLLTHLPFPIIEKKGLLYRTLPQKVFRLQRNKEGGNYLELPR